MSKTNSDRGARKCHICGFACTEWCPVCVAAFPARRPACEMSTEERVAELLKWGGPLEIPFTMVHERIDELVGRPVFTHELGGFNALISEIRRGMPANLAEVLDKVPAGKLITIGLEGSGAGSA